MHLLPHHHQSGDDRAWILAIPRHIRKRIGLLYIASARNAARYTGRPQSQHPGQWRIIRRQWFHEVMTPYIDAHNQR